MSIKQKTQMNNQIFNQNITNKEYDDELLRIIEEVKQTIEKIIKYEKTQSFEENANKLKNNSEIKTNKKRKYANDH